jgi:hypothetical protein
VSERRGPDDDRPDVFTLLLNDIAERDRIGAAEYGGPLLPFDGRDSLRDAYDEVLDLAVYLCKELCEREARQRATDADDDDDNDPK